MLKWKFSIGLAILFGIGFGDNWLTSLFGLNGKSWKWTLWNDTLGSWQGQFGTTPCNVSITKVDPNEVTSGDKTTVEGNVTSSYPGDKSGQVTIEYSKDNATWSPAKSTQCSKDGSFSIRDWYPTIETQGGTYHYWLRATYEGNNHYGAAEQEGNYSALTLTVLGGSDPNTDFNYVSDQGLCKGIYKRCDPVDVANKYPGYGDWYSYYWNYTDPQPAYGITTNKFYADDQYVYSWIKMTHIIESNTEIDYPWVPYIYWNLYDPWGNLVEHYADISDSYSPTYTPIPYVSTGGWIPDWWAPTMLAPAEFPHHVEAACLPYAIVDQTDFYANLPVTNHHVWPEWCCYARFNINSSWVDMGPCRVEVVTSLIPYQSASDTYQPRVVFNQTFTVTRHPTKTEILNPWTDESFPSMAYARYGGYFNFSVRTYALDTGTRLTLEGPITIQYSVDGGQNWTDDWTGYYNWLPYGSYLTGTYYPFKPDSPGDYWVRARWDNNGSIPWWGSDLFGSSTSDTVHVYAYEVPTYVPISVSVDNVIIGATVDITVQAYYEDVSFYDPWGPPDYFGTFERLAGENVTVEYNYWNGTANTGWRVIGVGRTDSNGEFDYLWTPLTIGTYRLRAYFFGDPPYAERWDEYGELFYVTPGKPTAVEVLAGANTEIERGAGSVQFKARVKDVGTGNYIGGDNCSAGAVEFFTYDRFHTYGELIGIDNDTDGDGIYTWTWNPENWTYTGTMQWSAYFTGAPGEYADSMANSSIEIWRSQVDISPAYHTIILKPGGSTSFDVSLTLSRGVPDTFNLSIEGLDSGWYKFSNDSVYLHVSPNLLNPDYPIPDTETVTLEVSLPIMPTVRQPWIRARPCLMNNPFTIVARSTLDPLSNDTAPCVLDVNYTSMLPKTPTGGLGIFIEPKTISITPPEEFGRVIRPSIYPTMPFTANVAVTNEESFYDVILVGINVNGIPSDNKADLAWFNWTSIRVFMPPHTHYTIGLQGIINVADVISGGITLTELTRMFHAAANSTVWSKGYATDTATITVTNTQYNQEAHITITPIDRQINTPGKKALFSVNIISTIAEDEHVELTISGDAYLGFNWTAQWLVLPSGSSQQYDLSVTSSGTSPGNFSFTVMNEVWSLSLTHSEASQMSLIETNSFTEYVQVTPQALLPGASFTYSPPIPLAGDTITFDASASTAAEKTIVSYAWDFGDSNTTTTTNAITTHAYSIGGTYNVNLTVTDTDGLTNSTRQTLTVYVQVTFNQAGVGSDFSGTVLTVDGIGYGVGDLPKTFTWAGGTTHNIGYQSPLIVGSGAKQYNWTSTSGMSELQSGPIGLTTSGSITGNYVSRVHDVVVVNVLTDRSWVYQGFSSRVNVTVLDNGDFVENVGVTVYYYIEADMIIGTQSVTLQPGQTQTLIYAWNTKTVPYGINYTITAVATITLDNKLADNTLAGGPVMVRILGDINGDGKLDARDIFMCAKAFGSRRGETRWNPNADINQDGKINIIDLFIVAKHYGTTT